MIVFFHEKAGPRERKMMKKRFQTKERVKKK